MLTRGRLVAVVVIGSLVVGVAALAAEPEPKLPPIKAISDPKPSAAVFKAASWKKPLIIDSAEAAARYYGNKALAELKKKVDLERQTLLIFAWRGSGRDRLTYAVAESYPEQVLFTFRRGRTRDLR